MAEAGNSTGARGAARRRLACLVAAAATVGAACSGDDGGGGGGDVVTGPVDFEATSQFLANASERSSSTAHRYEGSMTMRVGGGGEELSIDAPETIVGEQDGDRYEQRMDLEEFLRQFAGPASVLPGGDYTIEAAGDSEAIYIRAPLSAQIVEQAPPGRDLGLHRTLATLGDRWGRVELAGLDDFSLGQLANATGAPAGGAAEPQVLLDLVAGADDVEELGTDEIDGTGVNGLRAELTMGEMLEAQGTDPDTFIEEVAASGGGGAGGDAADQARLMESMIDAEIPYEVWVDGEGYVRRIFAEVDMVELLPGLFVFGEVDTWVTTQTTDYFDYGDPGIDIELPAEAVDATDLVRPALEAGP